jgi:hypothetical protein
LLIVCFKATIILSCTVVQTMVSAVVAVGAVVVAVVVAVGAVGLL